MTQGRSIIAVVLALGAVLLALYLDGPDEPRYGPAPVRSDWGPFLLAASR